MTKMWKLSKVRQVTCCRSSASFIWTFELAHRLSIWWEKAPSQCQECGRVDVHPALRCHLIRWYPWKSQSPLVWEHLKYKKNMIMRTRENRKKLRNYRANKQNLRPFWWSLGSLGECRCCDRRQRLLMGHRFWNHKVGGDAIRIQKYSA